VAATLPAYCAGQQACAMWRGAKTVFLSTLSQHGGLLHKAETWQQGMDFSVAGRYAATKEVNIEGVSRPLTLCIK